MEKLWANSEGVSSSLHFVLVIESKWLPAPGACLQEPDFERLNETLTSDDG